MPSMAASSVLPSSSTPRMSNCRSGRRAVTGMNAQPGTTRMIPMGTFTRKMPRHDSTWPRA